MTPDIISSLVSSIGVVGALVWYLYFNTTKTIPDLTRQYTESTERIASQFAETMESEREYRREEISNLKEWISNESKCRYNEDH